MKRLIDIVLGSLLLILAAPLLALIAVLILIDSGRPVLFVQERVGLRGRHFRMLKFRSMSRHNIPRARTFTSTCPDTPVFHDPDWQRNVTPVGRLLRRTSLDELPQLWNVVRGEMSLVGPRPVLPGDMVLYGEQAAKRCRVRPGMTGPYQVSGRKSLPLRTVVRLDLDYVDRHHLRYDLWVLLKTPLALLRPEDAN